MELRQIRSFLAVAETLHFGRTAEQLHLSQPALSLQIRGLEEELGVRLFERGRHGTTLTAAGAAFRQDAAGALTQLDQATRKARLAANGKIGLLRIGFISTAGAEILPQIMRGFRQSNPGAEFSVRNILTSDQVRMLDAGTLDIGFLRLPVDRHSGLNVIPVHREPFMLVVPSSHRFAKRKKVMMREVAEEEFLMYERSLAPGFHDLILDIFHRAKIVPKISQTAGEMPTLISLIDAGMGIAILPVSAVKHSAASVIGCRIADRIPLSEIGLAFRNSTKPPVVETFISFTLEKLVSRPKK